MFPHFGNRYIVKENSSTVESAVKLKLAQSVSWTMRLDESGTILLSASPRQCLSVRSRVDSVSFQPFCLDPFILPGKRNAERRVVKRAVRNQHTLMTSVIRVYSLCTSNYPFPAAQSGMRQPHTRVLAVTRRERRGTGENGKQREATG